MTLPGCFVIEVVWLNAFEIRERAFRSGLSGSAHKTGDMEIGKAYASKKGSFARQQKFGGANLGGSMRALRGAAILALACLGLILFASCGGGGTTITVEIQPSTAQTLDEGTSLTFIATLANDTSNRGVTWNLTAESTGCSGSGCGTLSNSLACAAPFCIIYTAPSNLAAELTGIVLQAVSNASSGATQTIDITVNLLPTFTTTSFNQCALNVFCLPSGANGNPYDLPSGETIVVTGGVAPYTYALSGALKNADGTSNMLPPGLTLNPGTGAIAGIPSSPTTGGTATAFEFTVTVTDSDGVQAFQPDLQRVSQAFQITVTPPTTLSITTTSLPNGTLNAAYSAPVATTGGVTPYVLSLIAGALPPGLSFNTASGQITGIPAFDGTATYPQAYPFTIQVTDHTLPTAQMQSKALSITIQKPPPLQITTTSPLPGGSVATAYQTSLVATGGVSPYTWSVISGQLPSGLALAPDGTISGTPVLTGTFTFTAQVADSELNPNNGQPQPATISQAFTITITAGGTSPNKLFQGQYTFLFQGFDSQGSVAIAGTFVADGIGDVTSGTEDIIRKSGVASAGLVGSYSLGSDGRGTLELIASPGVGPTLTTDYRLVLYSNGNARIIEDNKQSVNDNDLLNTEGEALLKPVASGATFTAANFSGNYAFEFTGQEASAANPVALAGEVHADGNQTLGPGFCDFNDNGAYSSQPLSGSMFLNSSSAPLGRNTGSMTFEPTGKSQLTLNFVFYLITPNDLFFVETNASTTSPPDPFRLSGEMILQQPGYAFTNASLAGTSVATGTGSNSGKASVFAGLLTAPACDGSTAASLNYDQNAGGSVNGGAGVGTPLSSIGKCGPVAGNGRVGFSGGFIPQLAAAYLIGPGQGFLIGSDAGVTSGLLEPQAAGPFADSSVQDGYTLGTAPLAENQVDSLVGQIFSDGLGNIPGTPPAVNVIDEVTPTAPEGAPNVGQSLTATINSLAANGRGLITTNSPTGFPTSLVFYIVSPSSFRAISTDNAASGNPLVLLGHPAVLLFDH